MYWNLANGFLGAGHVTAYVHHLLMQPEVARKTLPDR